MVSNTFDIIDSSCPWFPAPPTTSTAVFINSLLAMLSWSSTAEAEAFVSVCCVCVMLCLWELRVALTSSEKIPRSLPSIFWIGRIRFPPSVLSPSEYWSQSDSGAYVLLLSWTPNIALAPKFRYLLPCLLNWLDQILITAVIRLLMIYMYICITWHETLITVWWCAGIVIWLTGIMRFHFTLYPLKKVYKGWNCFALH